MIIEIGHCALVLALATARSSTANIDRHF